MRTHWQQLSVVASASIILGLLLLYRLGSLTGGLSSDEVSQQLFSASWHHILDNPLFAPLTVVQWLFLTVFSHHTPAMTRLPSLLFAILTLAAFSYVLKRWYGIRTALLGSILFGFSSWFLHASRLGTIDILYVWAMPTVLALQLAWQRYNNRFLFQIIALIGVAALLYIPGLLWPLIAGLLLQPQQLRTVWQGLQTWWRRALMILLFVILMAPLVYGLAKTPSLVQAWLGLPHSFTSATEVAKRLVESVSFFVIRGPQLPALWLDTLPILDIFAIFMAVLGVLFYVKHFTLPRTRLLGGLFVIGALFFALGGPVMLSILVPLVYLVVIAGVGYLLHDWLRVFPRNPLARSIGFGLVGIAIALSCAYNVRSYFVAWPHNPTTEQTFQHR